MPRKADRIGFSKTQALPILMSLIYSNNCLHLNASILITLVVYYRVSAPKELQWQNEFGLFRLLFLFGMIFTVRNLQANSVLW